MKKRIISFLVLAAALLSVAPMVNLASDSALPWREALKVGHLYNMDFAQHGLNLALYRFGISAASEQVVIGRKNWLFLADKYENTLTVTRNGQQPSDMNRSQAIRMAASAWDGWLRQRGVKVYRVMVGPNKSTIYPEYLPNWAHSIAPAANDGLFQAAESDLFIDLRANLIKAKGTSDYPIYYKTDTHWNVLGASVAFRDLADHVKPVAPELKWPAEDAFALADQVQRPGGDLARFLRMQHNIAEVEPVIGLQKQPINVTQRDFDSGKLLIAGGNPFIDATTKPILVHSDHALNHVRVLWLRDSFGTAMAPMMAATFEDVVQLHWIETFKPDGRMAELVEKWKPDYVFVTVVERLSQSELLASLPPIPVTHFRTETPVASTFGDAVASHDVTATGTKDAYRVSGPDPFIDYPLTSPTPASAAPSLGFELSCADGAHEASIQIFWLMEGEPYFHELHSTRIKAQPGWNSIDFRGLPDWASDRRIVRVRMDMESQDKCQEFSFSNAQIAGMPAES